MNTITELSPEEIKEISGGMPSGWGILGMICGAVARLCDGYQTVPYGYCEP